MRFTSRFDPRFGKPSDYGRERRATSSGGNHHPTCIKRITLHWRTNSCGLHVASLARFGKPSDYVANSRSAFQAEGAKDDVLRRTPITQRALNESRCIGGQTVAVYKSLRSLGLENRATMSPIVARLSKPRERRATSSGGNHHPTCIKRITLRWQTHRCGSQVASILGLENRATMGESEEQRPPVETIIQRALNESRCVGGQTVAVYTSLRSLGLENRATMSPIVARLSKPRERRIPSSGGNQSPNVH